MIADPDERLAEDGAFDGEEVGGGARDDAGGRHEDRLARGRFAVHDPLQQGCAFVADSREIVVDAGKGNGLVVADEPVVADADDRDLLGDAQPRGARGGLHACGVRVVIAEDGQRLGRVLQPVAEVSARTHPVVEVLGDEGFGENPTRWFQVAVRRPGRAEALEAKRVRMAPDGGEPGGVAEVAFEEVLGGEPSAGGMVARDARNADFGMIERQVDDGDAPSAERPNEVQHCRPAADGGQCAVARPSHREAGKAVGDHQVPATFLGELRDAAHPHMADGSRHQKDVSLGCHADKDTMSGLMMQVSREIMQDFGIANRRSWSVNL